MNQRRSVSTLRCARYTFGTLAVFVAVFTVSLMGCNGQSLLVYRLPYADGTSVYVSRDHLTHTPANRLDLVGQGAAGGPKKVVAAQTGIIRYIVDGNTEVCCGGSCANNYVWIEHLGGEWSKYSHLDTGSVTGNAGLSVGDLVVAGTFLGYESNIGRACGVHLHFEVAVPNDPANPLQAGNGGFINGINRIPRFCGVPGGILVAGDTWKADHCALVTTCIRSVESPTTVGACEDGLSGDVCVEQIADNALTSTYMRGTDFASSSLQIHLEWCPNATCDPNVSFGRAVQVVVYFIDGNKDPLVFIANCQNRMIHETVHGVDEVVIEETPNLIEENVICLGNEALHAYAKWEICEVSPSFEEI